MCLRQTKECIMKKLLEEEIERVLTVMKSVKDTQELNTYAHTLESLFMSHKRLSETEGTWGSTAKRS